MLQLKNGWVLTDADCMQCGKRVDKRIYYYVQAVCINGYDYDKDDENLKYVVMSDIIYLDDYTQEDIDNAISGYYDNIKQMAETYYCSVNDEFIEQIIAECIFEREIECDLTYGIICSWNEAEKIIQEYMDRN